MSRMAVENLEVNNKIDLLLRHLLMSDGGTRHHHSCATSASSPLVVVVESTWYSLPRTGLSKQDLEVFTCQFNGLSSRAKEGEDFYIFQIPMAFSTSPNLNNDVRSITLNQLQLCRSLRASAAVCKASFPWIMRASHLLDEFW